MQDIADLIVPRTTPIREAMKRLNSTAGRLLLITGRDGRLVQVVSDGDLRRLILAGHELDETLEHLPVRSPLTAPAGASREALLEIFGTHQINHVPLVDAAGRPVGIASARDTGRILLSTPHMGEEEQRFVASAFETNWIAPVGPNIDGFEADISAWAGGAHVAALSSGTAAIHLGLIVLDVGPGDRVFCSTMTFSASVNPILYQGAEPVFIDSAPGSWNMCPATLARALDAAAEEGRLPKAVIVVSLYGQSADMDPIKAACDRHGVPILEDAAEALGATYKGRAAGTTGLLGVYSFNGNKIITTSGGGALISDDKALIDRAKFLSTQAKEPALHYEHKVVGYNYRMSNLLAGVGRGQMKVLDDRVAGRRAIFEAYRAALSDMPGVVFLDEEPDTVSTQWLSCMLVLPEAGHDPTAVIAALDAEGVEARPVWKPMHRQPIFERYEYYAHAGNRSVSDELFAAGLCLPSGTNMSTGDLDRVIAALRRALSPPPARATG